jgi:hypothetical protein
MSSRARRHLVPRVRGLEHADGARDRGQRIAKLVPQHGQELVLGAVGGLRFRPGRVFPGEGLGAVALRAPSRGGQPAHAHGDGREHGRADELVGATTDTA